MKRLLCLLIMFTALLSIYPSQVLLASSFQDNLDATAEGTGHATLAERKSIEGTMQTLINTVLTFLGVVFLLLLIYGGYIWLMARGDSGEVDKAKDIIRNAIIGLIIVLMAYAISYFVMTIVI